MAPLIKLVVLLCAAVAVFASPIDRDELDIETVLLEDRVAQLAAGKDQSTYFGNCQSLDKLLFAENVDVKSGVLQIKKKDVTYPPDHSNNGGLISCIKIIDQLKTGKNASYKISSGGISQRFAIINLTSERGQPIKYLVQIYGR